MTRNYGVPADDWIDQNGWVELFSNASIAADDGGTPIVHGYDGAVAGPFRSSLESALRSLSDDAAQRSFRMRHLVFAALVLSAACTDRPYRLPYADGTRVTITADHTDHQNPPEKMFDLRATQSGQVLAAAAPGWVREIKDSGDSTATTNNYVWIEHPLDYCQPVDGFTSGPSPSSECRICSNGPGKCNEWTLYAHMAQNSVRGFAGLSEDDWVDAGQPIGIEGDVGFTPCGSNAGQPLCGRHVHFTVFEIDRDTLAAQSVPSVNGDYEDYAAVFGRTERVPLFCTDAGYRYPRTGATHVAAPCP